MMFGCLRVEPTQNSAVTFFWYSFWDSPDRLGLNSLTAKMLPLCFPLISRTVPPAPDPSTRPHLPYFLARCAWVASESDVIGWAAGVDALLLVEMEEVRESTLCCLGLCCWVRAGALPSGGALLRETLLELDGEGERVGDRSWERLGDLGLPFFSRSRRRKPERRSSLRESAIECASSPLGLGEEEGESLAGCSAPGMDR